MAQTKISALPAASALDGSELVPIVQGGATKQTTTQDIADLGGGGPGAVDWGDIGGTLSSQTDLQTALDLKEALYRTFDRKTGDYPLVLADSSKGIEMNVAGANTVTVPLNATQAFPVGTLIPVVQYGAGLTSIVATGGVTINTSAGNLDSPGQYSPMFLRKIATNEWYLWNGTSGVGTGDLQDVLDAGSTSLITTDVEINRTGEFVFELLDTGINIGHLDDPVTISSGEVASGGRIDLYRDSVLRAQIDTNNDHYSTGGTSHHRFFAAGVGAQIRLMEASGSGTNYIGLKAPDDVTTAQVYTFPAAGPSNNGDVLASTTAGQLSWATPASGADASETVKGIIEIATQAEVTTGTDDVRAVTPLKLAVATRGIQDLYVPAAAMWPRSTLGCENLTRHEMATSLVSVQTLDFDQTTQEFAEFHIVFPRKYNLGTITVVPYWTALAGSGTVQWGISGGAYSNDDALTVALGTAQTSDDTLIATNDLHIGPETSAITLAGTPASTDFLVLRVSRNVASDTLSADACLLGISIRLTTNAAVDA